MKTTADPRESMASQLLKRGHASIKEILTASFGEWPLKGLEIGLHVDNDQSVTFKPLTNRGVAARASFGGKKTIWVNAELCPTKPTLFGSSLNSILGHETTHILQADHLKMAAETFGSVTRKKDFRTYTEFSKRVAMSDTIMSDLTDDKENLGRFSLRTAFNAAIRLMKPSDYLSYMREGREIQARMHEIIMDGYQRWNRMPQNKDELWAALTNAGLKPPLEIARHLESLPTNSNVQDFLSKQATPVWSAREIQTISRTLSKAGLDIFWNKTLPALYADLIEMYGDTPGRARFGMGVNPKTEKKHVPAANVSPSPA